MDARAAPIEAGCLLAKHYSLGQTQKFPFSVKTAHALKIPEPHVITVTGQSVL